MMLMIISLKLKQGSNLITKFRLWFLTQIVSNYSYDLTKIINLKYQYDIATGNINSNVSKIHSIISKNHNQSNNLEKNRKKRVFSNMKLKIKTKLLVKKIAILLII